MLLSIWFFRLFTETYVSEPFSGNGLFRLSGLMSHYIYILFSNRSVAACKFSCRSHVYYNFVLVLAYLHYGPSPRFSAGRCVAVLCARGLMFLVTCLVRVDVVCWVCIRCPIIPCDIDMRRRCCIFSNSRNRQFTGNCTKNEKVIILGVIYKVKNEAFMEVNVFLICR
jgi:hypothetical protein